MDNSVEVKMKINKLECSCCGKQATYTFQIMGSVCMQVKAANIYDNKVVSSVLCVEQYCADCVRKLLDHFDKDVEVAEGETCP